MSLITDRLGFLIQRYSAAEIAEITGISLSSISPSIGQVDPLEGNIRRNVYNLYQRTIYKALRDAGATAIEARRYRNLSVQRVMERLGYRSELVTDLAQVRFETYKQYLIQTERYTNDEDTLATLKEAIAKAMGKSKLPPSKYDYESYPTLSYGSLDDGF